METQGIENSIIVWNQLVFAHAMTGQRDAPHKAEAALDCMLQKGVRPDVLTYSQVMSAWSRSSLPEAPEKVESVFQRMMTSGIKPDLYSYSHLIYSYALRGNAEKAESFLGDMIAGGIVPNLVLQAWSNSSLQCAAEKAESVFKRMKAAGVEPNEVSYLHLISTHASRGNADRAEELLLEMIENFNATKARVRIPDDPAKMYNIVLYAYCNSKDSNALQKAEKMIEDMTNGKFSGVRPSNASFISSGKW